jgi:hypothetical protein
LFTLLEEDTPSNHAWDIFYHFKLTEHALGLVTNYSRKLAEPSVSPETWRQSKYSSFLKMVDAATLSELHRYWTLYAEFIDLPSDRLDKIQSEPVALSKLMSDQAKSALNVGASRSATVVWREAMKPVNEQFAHYWEHGTTATTNKEIKKTTKINPTFCYSSLGETFSIYDNTFPQGYHFAPAFSPIEFDPAGPATNSAMAKAKQQFQASCVALQASKQAGSIVLQFFVGDALALCRALHQYSLIKDVATEEFAAPWRATPIDLSEHAATSPPDSFDVIDCSLLASQLGLVNFLLAGQPLLKKRPASQAVLYTDLPMEVGFSIDSLMERLCGNVPSIGTLIGLVPRPYVSLFTSQSNTHELLVSENATLYMERIAWVDPSGGDKHTYTHPTPVVSFKSFELAQLLFSVYRSMFYFDTIPTAQLERAPLDELRVFSSSDYTRETVAMLFAHARSRFQVLEGDWASVATTLLGFIGLHSTQYSTANYFHDLKTHFRLRGLAFKNSDAEFTVDVRQGVFSDWSEDPPRLVCVVLIVPGNQLDPIREDKTEPGPRLVCNLDTTTHSSLQMAWGKLVPLDEGRYAIEEDSEGFRGRSDLVVSFWTDAEVVCSPKLTVSLSLRKTPLVVAQYTNSLGPELNLFTTTGSDTDHVIVLRERPMGMSRTQQARRLVPSPLVGTEGTKYQIKAVEDGPRSHVDSMVAQVHVGSSAEQTELSKGVKLKTMQIGPCTLQLSFTKSAHVLRFPYPFRGTDATVRVVGSERIDVSGPVIRRLWDLSFVFRSLFRFSSRSRQEDIPSISSLFYNTPTTALGTFIIYTSTACPSSTFNNVTNSAG